MAYQPAQARLVAGHRHRLRQLRRMHPNAVYYVVVGGVAGLVGVVVDAVSRVPWWAVAGSGLMGGWVFTWLTALDDVAHPWRSIRILAATVRDPTAAMRVRTRAYEIPLFALSHDWGGSRWLSGASWSNDGRLLAAVCMSASATWSGPDANVEVTTVTRPPRVRPEGLPSGIAHQLPQLDGDPSLEGMHVDELVARLRPVPVIVDGWPLTATVLDLSDLGNGWFAHVRLDDRYVLEVTGQGIDPDHLALDQVSIDDLPDSQPARERHRRQAVPVGDWDSTGGQDAEWLSHPESRIEQEFDSDGTAPP